jgi:hypothetical protein
MDTVIRRSLTNKPDMKNPMKLSTKLFLTNCSFRLSLISRSHFWTFSPFHLHISPFTYCTLLSFTPVLPLSICTSPLPYLHFYAHLYCSPAASTGPVLPTFWPWPSCFLSSSLHFVPSCTSPQPIFTSHLPTCTILLPSSTFLPRSSGRILSSPGRKKC